MVDANAGLSYPSSGYPTATVETIYTDGVSSVLPAEHVMKLYLSRLDGNFLASAPNQVLVVAQLMMPTDVFIQTAQFFNNVIENMLKQGLVSPEQVARARATAASGEFPHA